MKRITKLQVLSLVIVLLITSMGIIFTACNEGEQEPKDYGTFYTLQEAYDLGYIDMQDLKSIAYYHNLETAPDYVDKTLELQKSNSNKLDKNKIAKIKNTWIKEWKKSMPELRGYEDKFVLEQCYGFYKDSIAIVTSVPITVSNATIECRQVEGIDIWYANHFQQILIWRDEKINLYGNYTLQEAYDLGYIDMQGLRSTVFHLGDFEQVKSFGEDFVATELNEDLFSNELSTRAIDALIQDEKRMRPNLSDKTYGIDKYLGNYGDIIVYLVKFMGTGFYPADVISVSVAGIKFSASYPYKIIAFKY